MDSLGFILTTCESHKSRPYCCVRWFSGAYFIFFTFRDISIQVLGYWFWWLFIVPSLRSRRPKGDEKKALDIAFLGTPIVSALAPVVTKDTGLIWLSEY